jgi:pimeloyl-ACP methyl ester carboxylesterase
VRRSSTTVTFLVFILTLSVFVPVATVRVGSQSNRGPWDGGWNTYWTGHYLAMVLSQGPSDGSHVDGCFSMENFQAALMCPYTMSGQASGGTLNGTFRWSFSQASGGGSFEFKLSGDGKSFAGKGEGEMPDSQGKPEHWSGSWTGQLSESTDKEPEAIKTPVIFVPGIGGSQLLYERSNGRYEIWPVPGGNLWRGFLWQENQIAFRLGLGKDGKTPYDIRYSARIYPSRPIEKVVVGDILRSTYPAGIGDDANFYSGMIRFLEDKGYKELKDLFVFPYDWRLDNSIHVEELNILVDKALELNPDSKKVTLLAHSMGGLISRAYVLSSESRAAKIDSLISIGTPYWGAPKVYYGLIMGYNFGNDCFLQAQMKWLQQNFTSSYQLLPRVPFIWDSKTKSLLSLDESYKIRYKGWNDFNSVTTTSLDTDAQYSPLTENIYSFDYHGRKLLENAKAFYASAGTPQNPVPLPVKHYVIVGVGISTLIGYDLVDFKWSLLGPPPWRYLDLSGREVELIPIFADGDGQVPLLSAEVGAGSITYYVKHDIARASSSEHGYLAQNNIVQSIVGKILDNDPPAPEAYKYKTPEILDKTDFTLHSDAHLVIVDESTGERLGYDEHGNIEESLAGSFLSMDGVEYASLIGATRPLKVVVNGIQTGNFTLTVNVASSKSSTVFEYRDVAVENDTVAQFVINPSQTTTKSIPSLSVTTGGQTLTVPATILSTTEDQTWMRALKELINNFFNFIKSILENFSIFR